MSSECLEEEHPQKGPAGKSEQKSSTKNTRSVALAQINIVKIKEKHNKINTYVNVLGHNKIQYILK